MPSEEGTLGVECCAPPASARVGPAPVRRERSVLLSDQCLEQDAIVRYSALKEQCVKAHGAPSIEAANVDRWQRGRRSPPLRCMSRCRQPVRAPITSNKNPIVILIVIACFVFIQISHQHLHFSSPARSSISFSQRHVASQESHPVIPNPRHRQLHPASSQAFSTLVPWRSQQMLPFSVLTHANGGELPTYGGHDEPRAGSLSRRGARNASLAAATGSGSWHFPRISPEQAAEVLLTGAQVINKIAQAETPLNYCKTPDNQEGECSDIRKCIWLVLDKARLKQSVCLRNLIIPAVCCPISNANNTPIANMIQSTLEPVLFRPKGPKNKKPAGTSSQQPQQSPSGSRPIENGAELELTASSSPSSTRNHTITSLASATTAPTSSTTTSATGSTSTLSAIPNAQENPNAAQDKPHNQLFQDALETQPQPHADNSYLYQSGNSKKADFNRTVSLRYPWANETCGESGRMRTGRIVGGSDSKLGQWPWMTAMYLNKRSAFSSGVGEFWCGGALINRRFILTAAHCLSDQRGNRYKNDQVTIKLGGVDLTRHQAPPDILRNADLGESRAMAEEPEQSFATNHPHQGQQWRSARTGAARQRASSQRNGNNDDEEEFSWTAFITKALGLGSSSSSSASSLNPAISTTASPINLQAPNGSLKALDSGPNASASVSQKQLLAAHAKKVYFKEYKVANIKQHPKFQRHGFYNDIGLIELKSDVDYDELVSPICLPTEYDLKRDLTGYLATVLGWGTLSYGGQGSKLLQQVAMPVWSNKDCDERYLQHIGKTFLCAGFLNGGKDACQGDSGGPLMVSDQTGRWTLHGVVSFGKTCAQAGYPGVYTRVTEYLDWIRDNTDLSAYLQSGQQQSQLRQQKSAKL